LAKNKVTITGIGKARDNALKFLGNTFKDYSFLSDFGKEAASQIVKRTQDGREEYKQKPLTESTIISREILSVDNSFGPFGSAKKSNLTMSGQLLRSISSKVETSTSTVTVFIQNGTRYKYIIPNSITALAYSKRNKELRNKYFAIWNTMKQQGSSKSTNSDIKKSLEEKGRKFFFISNKLQALLESKIAAQLRKKLALYNKVVRKLS